MERGELERGENKKAKEALLSVSARKQISSAVHGTASQTEVSKLESIGLLVYLTVFSTVPLI